MKVKIPKVFMESEMENNKIGSSYHEIQTIYSLWRPSGCRECLLLAGERVGAHGPLSRSRPNTQRCV